MINLGSVKLTKDMVMIGLSLGTSVAGLVVDSYNKNRQAEIIADLVVEKLKKQQTNK